MSDYETIQQRRNVIVGVFVVVAVCALVGLIWIFGDLPIAVSKFRSFQIVIQFASAPGIQKNTSVQLSGYQVGRVIAVMSPEIIEDLRTKLKYHQTKVILAIDKKYVSIPSNAEVKLMRRGFGSSFIEIVIDPMLPLAPLDVNDPSTIFMQAGMLLQGSTGTISEFLPEQTQSKIEGLVDSLKSLVDNTNDILGDGATKENIKATLANLSKATEEAAKTLREIRKFSAAGVTTMKNANAQISRFTDAVVETSNEINLAIAELRSALAKANSGEGSIGKLLNDGRLYENLLDSSQELQATLAELKQFIAESREDGLKIKW